MLRTLKITNFRCFQAFELQQLGRINLLVGTNNSGKTSILESIRLLLGTSQNLEFLSELMLNRSEYTWHENNQNNPILNIRHLFFDHKSNKDNTFWISGSNQKSARELIASIKEDEDQVAFFDDNLNQLTDLILSLEWSQDDKNDRLKIPLFDQGISLDYLHRLRSGLNSQSPNIQFISSSFLTTRKMLELFDRIVLTPEETVLYEALKIIEANIERIASVSTERYRYLGEHGGFVVKLSNSNERIPIGSMGDGVWRILGLTLAIVNSKNGFLLVDGIDTGLHFTAMSGMWKLLWEAAKRLNVQVFATTHNSDCWTSLAAIANVESPSEEGITIQRIEKGKQRSTVFTERQVVIAAERGIEVR